MTSFYRELVTLEGVSEFIEGCVWGVSDVIEEVSNVIEEVSNVIETA